MDPLTRQQIEWDAVLKVAERQHGVISGRQLLRLGLDRDAIRHRVRSKRLHPLMRGVYAVGRPEVSREGRWMAAVLACGDGAVLSHSSAAALMRIGVEGDVVEVSTPRSSHLVRSGLRIHRRAALRLGDVGRFNRIPVTSPALTLIDLAADRHCSNLVLERGINEADKYDLITPHDLRAELDAHPSLGGVDRLRLMQDRRTFRLTREELERRFLPLARDVGLPTPLTGQWVNGFEVDFYWPDLGFVVETDGLRYHRTPAEQARDRERDQAHTAAGMAHLRFTHEQVRYRPEHVRATLRRTVGWIKAAGRPRQGEPAGP
jgi:very-short-patch-repair endonuclease